MNEPSVEAQPPSGYVQKAMELADEYGDMRIMVSRGRLPRAEVDEARESLRLYLESAFSKKAEASPAEEGRDAADARRYRWLRQGNPLTVVVPTPTEDKPHKKATVIYGPNPEPAWAESLDHAIDAAITATKEPKHE